MRVSKRVVIVVASLLAVSIVVTSSPVAAGSCWDYKTKERKMARKINYARASRGLGKLRLDRHLSRVARGHTRAKD
jgi:uncharacterized protein YkwD